MFDIIIFIVVLYFMWKGYQRGFARELPRIGALIVSMIIGIIFYSIVAMVINSTALPDWIGSHTSDEFLARLASEEAMKKKEADETEDVEVAEDTEVTETEESTEPTEQTETTEETAAPASEEETTTDENTEEKSEDNAKIREEEAKKDMQEFVNRGMNVKLKESSVNQVFGAINNAENKERMIGEFFVMYMSLIFVFLVAYFVIRHFSKKKKLYRKIKIPVQLNPAFGGCVGVVRGILIVYIACAFLVICEPLIPSDLIIEQVAKSEIVQAMYDKNYIANIVARQDFLSGGI